MKWKWCVERRKLKVIVNKSKAMKVSKSGKYWALNVQLNGEKMEELDCFRNLGVDLYSYGGMEAEWVNVDRLLRL